MNAVAIESVPLLGGVYRKVQIGVTFEDGRQSPLWSVDIATHIDGVTVVGNGPTLAIAAEDATNKVALYSQDVP